MVKKVVQQGRSDFDARSVLQYVSTAKLRERRWWLFSTFPSMLFDGFLDHG